MNSLAKTIIDLSSSIASHHRVDAGLAAVAERIQTTDSVLGAVGRALGELRERATALREAEFELRKLTERLEQRAAGLRFTSEGWRERKPELEQLLAERRGLAEWLNDWFTAAASVQLEALDRLTDDVALRDAARALADRLRTARHAIAGRNWHQARLVLEAGVDGLEVAGRSLPASSVRRALRLLCLRIAIESGAEAETVRTLFGAARAEEWTETLGALSDRCRRITGLDLSDGNVKVSTLDDAKNLDVAVELIYRARNEEVANLGLDAARLAIQEIPFIDEMEGRIAALLTDVPQEMSIAAAERALEEQDYQVFDRAIAEAKDLTGAGFADQATMYELIAKAAEARSLPTTDLVEALKLAGKNRLWASQFELARKNLERAAQLCPEDVEAQLSLADAVHVLSSNAPLRQFRPDIEAALRDIEIAHNAGRISRTLSWAYQVEAYLRGRVAEWVAEESEEQDWRALIARARSVPGDMHDAGRWAELASNAEQLEMPRAALTFLERALISRFKADLYLDRAQILTNCGMHREALEVLAADRSSYGTALRGYSLLRLNEPDKSVDSLMSIEPLTSAWFWARDTLICGLILTGRMDELGPNVERLRTDVADREGEYAYLYYTAKCFLYLGEFERARELAEQHKAPNQHFDKLSGMASLLSGKGSAAVAAIEACLQKATNPRIVDDWLNVERPVITRLAEVHRVTLPPLADLDEFAKAQLSRLQAAHDPYRELTEVADRAGVGRNTAATAKAITEILLAVATRDGNRAASFLAKSSHVLEPSDLEAMKHLVEASTVKERPHAETAEDDATSLSSGEPPAAEAASPRSVQLCLPECWFEGHDDPPRTHDLFTRYLPEARLRQPGLPPVLVVGEPEFDPDRYAMMLHGSEIGNGRIDPSYLYALPEVVDLIDEPRGEFTRFDADLVRIDRQEGRAGLGKLLTMPAEEVVVRRLATAVTAQTLAVPDAGAPA